MYVRLYVRRYVCLTLSVYEFVFIQRMAGSVQSSLRGVRETVAGGWRSRSQTATMPSTATVWRRSQHGLHFLLLYYTADFFNTRTLSFYLSAAFSIASKLRWGKESSAVSKSHSFHSDICRISIVFSSKQGSPSSSFHKTSKQQLNSCAV